MSISLTVFPAEITYNIAKSLTINDLNNCLRVSRAWKGLFDSEIMWEPSAKKLKVKRIEINSLYQFLMAIPTVFGWSPYKLKNYLTNTYKFFIHQKFLLEEENIRKTYPKEFLKVFDGATVIRRLPTYEITLDELTTENNGNRKFHYFKDEYFSSPLVRVILKLKDDELYFILFRIRDNETGKIYRDAISFYSFAGMRFFRIDSTRPEQRVICPKFANVTAEKLDRLYRLIHKEPVGILTQEKRFAIIEGPKRLPNGKSVLELC